MKMKGQTMKISDCLEKFLSYLLIEKACVPSTITVYKTEINKFISYFNTYNLSFPGDISISFLRDYIYSAKQKRNLTQCSISKIIAILKSFFNYLEEEDIIVKNPTRKIKMPKKKHKLPRIISQIEFEQLMSSIDFSPFRISKNSVRNKLIFSMLFYTGIRRNELLSLSFDDLNLSSSTITIRSGKGGKDRIIPLHPKVKCLLELYIGQRLPLKDNALFIGEAGKRLCKATLINLLKTCLVLSGLDKKGYSLHSFRHSFATHLIESGVDLFKVQRLLGHESLDSTKIYISFNSSQMAKTIERL